MAETNPRDAAIQAAADVAELRLQLAALQERLAAAEQVCVLFSWTSSGGDSDRDRAVAQAWMDWKHGYAPNLPDPQSPEWQARIQDLANRRTAVRTITVARIRRDRDEGTDA
jgi:hypothetical protein